LELPQLVPEVTGAAKRQLRMVMDRRMRALLQGLSSLSEE
jgi:hypothetical protein